MQSTRTNLCSFIPCGRTTVAKGLCGGHYQQRRNGRTLAPLKSDITAQQRLDEHTVKGAGCWEWSGALNPDGYGHVSIRGRVHAAHRVAYELAFGELPDDVLVDHRCRNPRCVNPQHLQRATRKLNAENRRGANATSRSKVRGVYWHLKTQKWATQVVHHGHRYSAGYFDALDDAERAVVDLRLRLFTNNLSDR